MNEEDDLYDEFGNYIGPDLDSGDEDDKGGSKRGKKHMLGPHQICALPSRDEDHASYNAGFRIMAVYPGTTSFYPGTVMSSPRNQATARIVIKFDDDEVPFEEREEVPVVLVRTKHGRTIGRRFVLQSDENIC